MEKQEGYNNDSCQLSNTGLGVRRKPARDSGMTEKILMCVVCLLILWTFAGDAVRFHSRSSVFHQGNVTWSACDDYIECGRLDVPLDYLNATAGTASLSLARFPATHKAGKIGTLLVNPGGPGGSGVLFLYRAGKRLNDLLGGKYDIVSWDPRGINGTTPRVECFPSQTDQDIAGANTHEEILPDMRNLSDPLDLAAYKAGFKLADARNEAFARLCEQHSGDTLKYVGTATVVRDLERISSELEGEDTLINFWGMSYGTVIGTYLVNMFPDRIGRIVIDAVVDPVMWAHDPITKWWNWSLTDTEKDLQNFYNACADAGPGRCALASKGSTAEDISCVIEDLLAKLYERPLAVHNSTRPGPLTASMVRAAIFTALYRPLAWPSLAADLSAALEGDGVPLVNQFLKAISLNTSIPASTIGAGNAVICTDSPAYEGLSKTEEVQEILDEMTLAQKTSPHFAGFPVPVCHHMTARSVERFTGPFNRTLNNEILIIGNTADPVTPLQNAKKVNELMPHSSRLVIQDGSGHGSFAMASLCTAKVLREYFLEGTLPQNGIICPTDEILFPDEATTNSEGMVWLKGGMKAYTKEELELLKTVRELGEVFGSNGLGKSMF